MDEAGIKNNIPNTASSTTSSSPRVSWSKTVTQRKSSPPLSSSPYASLGFSSSLPYASFGFFRQDNDDNSTPRRKKLMGTIERNTAGGRSQSYTIQELSKSPKSKKKTLDTFSSSLPPPNNPSSPSLNQSPTTSSMWKFALGRKNNLSKSSLSSTTGTDTEWETTSLIVETTHNEMNPTTTNKWTDSFDNQSFHSSFDFSSIHFLDDILEHNKHHDKDDDDDDDTVLVDDTQSEPNMQQSAADQLFHYQMNRIKQDRNQIQERCAQLQKKYDRIKVKASLLRNVNQSLEANTEPIERHVLDAKKSGNDIEQFLQGKPMVDPDDSVSEMTMDTYLYY